MVFKALAAKWFQKVQLVYGCVIVYFGICIVHQLQNATFCLKNIRTHGKHERIVFLCLYTVDSFGDIFLTLNYFLPHNTCHYYFTDNILLVFQICFSYILFTWVFFHFYAFSGLLNCCYLIAKWSKLLLDCCFVSGFLWK